MFRVQQNIAILDISVLVLEQCNVVALKLTTLTYPKHFFYTFKGGLYQKNQFFICSIGCAEYVYKKVCF